MYRGLLGGGAAVRGGGAVVHADDVAELIQGEAEGVREIGRQQCALRQAPYRKHSGASSCTTRTTAHAHAHTTAHAHAHTTAHALPHTHTHTHYQYIASRRAYCRDGGSDEVHLPARVLGERQLQPHLVATAARRCLLR
jgi:hypothetical protein